MIHRRPTSDEELSDYIDGRMDEDRRAALEARIAADPGLSRRYAAMVEQDRLLRRLGEEVLSEPVPERLMDVLRHADPDGDDEQKEKKSSKLPQIAMLATAIGWSLLVELAAHNGPVRALEQQPALQPVAPVPAPRD